MKIAEFVEYGSPEVFRLIEVEKPIPGNGEILVKVYATTVTATDCAFRKGKPFITRFFTGFSKPKHKILGCEFAGVIEQTGENVKFFNTGDRVYGTLPGYGAYSGYVCLSEKRSTLAMLPEGKSYEKAIACCDGFLTALPFLRDKGDIKEGHKVLVYGASGSVGSAAVQLAVYFGAEVTGVCSTSNLELVKSLGADFVIDYTKEDFTDSAESYDIIFDTVGKISFPECISSLNPHGIFLEAAIGFSVFPFVLWTSVFGNKKAKIAATGMRDPEERTKDLEFIKKLHEEGAIKPVIDRIYGFEQISEAHSYVDKGHKKGNVVIKM